MFAPYIADNSSSSYNSTDLSVQSIFEMDYPVVPDSEKYSNTVNFFHGSLSIDKPKTLLQQTLLNSGYDKLYWSGHNGARCKVIIDFSHDSLSLNSAYK